MAFVLPSEPLSCHRTEIRELHRWVKELPETCRAWFAIGPSQGRPPVFVIGEQQCGFLLEVCTVPRVQIESMLLPMGPSENGGLPPGLEEAMALGEFVQDIAQTLALPSGLPVPIEKVVLFPHVEAELIRMWSERMAPDPTVHYLGCGGGRDPGLSQRLFELGASAMPPDVFQLVRMRMSPELMVPTDFRADILRNRWQEEVSPPVPLDDEQEAAAKEQLEPPTGEEATWPTRLVTGLAGSGKSMVLLARVQLLARLRPGSRMLVLTHHPAHAAELEHRFHRLAGPGHPVEWLGFHAWIQRFFDPEPEILSNRERARIAESLLPPGLNRSVAFLLDEIDWIREQCITRLGAYLIADRSGRAAGLNTRQREAVWDFQAAYQAACEQRGKLDVSSLVMQVWKQLRSQKVGASVFDAIFIDDAQFFAPMWFDCVKTVLKPGGQLFLAADPTQGFLRRRTSWSAAGIEVRGRSTRLHEGYRCSRAILHFASQFYRSRLQDEVSDEIDLPSSQAISHAPPAGGPPHILLIEDAQNRLDRVVHDIQRLVDRGCAPGQILVLHEIPTRLERLREAINAKFGRGRALLLRSEAANARVLARLCPMSIATGLEAPVVFVLGLDELFEKERDPDLNEDEREALIRDHTRKIYMTFTRAGQKLIVILKDARSLIHFNGLDAILPRIVSADES